jgi:transcriptional regulator with XRE-family HTH domain
VATGRQRSKTQGKELLTFGEFLRQERERLGLTQGELSKAIRKKTNKRVSQARISAWEDGADPQMSNLVAVASYFDWDMNRVVTMLGARITREGFDRVMSEVEARPLLRRVLTAARDLENSRLEHLAELVEGWHVYVSARGEGVTHRVA